MTDNETNSHTVLHSWGKTVYWKDGKACGLFDEWSSVDVHVWPDPLQVPVVRFTKAHAGDFENTLRALDRAFESGKKARSKELRQLLGVSE